ncbi:probable exported protein [Bacillus sp. OxB-1]|uniref:glycerophosphodiester phosphodiesterase family protein n=1 Tax=Bacillus sp. (strain OxB-1) TaxID=98228 RepID=UPI00058206E9|nr:glycerophosphodiester phosphodiesterase family protein [Bacillus sp. OxB-1]BAQ10404.1 probable exported protein [Bacillus sp. OxB-1]
MGKKTKVALSVGAAGIAAWAASKVVAKPVPREGKKALDFENPIILAHRGGLADTPEHTMAAFTASAELGVHGFAIDARLTKDEEIILFHDETVDRTTDLSGNVSDFTLQELKAADAGYGFSDDNGIFKYRDQGEQVVTLREMLELFPHMFVMINLVDAPDTYEGSLMPSKLWGLLDEIGVEDRIAVTSPYDEQTDRFNLYAQHKIAIGAGVNEVKKAYAAYASRFGHLYNPRADLFRVPDKKALFHYGSDSFVQFLSRLNIPIYFEAITDRGTFTRLLNAGAAGFIVDNPELALEIVQEHGGE